MTGPSPHSPCRRRLKPDEAAGPRADGRRVDLVGFGIVIPLLTFYAEEYGAGPVAVTLLMAVYSLAQFLGRLGRARDKYGRRPIMLFSIGSRGVSPASHGPSHR